MRDSIRQNKNKDSRLKYRGASASRIDNLTDAVFGIAITLLIFNLANPNSFDDLMNFAMTLPAFLLSIGFLVLIWNEHYRFSEVYSMDDTGLVFLNTIFLALIIFFVYPLRFLSLLFTNFIFQTNVGISIDIDQMHFLMIYYGLAISALYFVIFLFYYRAGTIKDALELSPYEVFFTRWQRKRLLLLFLIPLFSVLLTISISFFTIPLAAFFGGMTYWLFWPASLIWDRQFKKKSVEFAKDIP